MTLLRRALRRPSESASRLADEAFILLGRRRRRAAPGAHFARHHASAPIPSPAPPPSTALAQGCWSERDAVDDACDVVDRSSPRRWAMDCTTSALLRAAAPHAVGAPAWSNEPQLSAGLTPRAALCPPRRSGFEPAVGACKYARRPGSLAESHAAEQRATCRPFRQASGSRLAGANSPKWPPSPSSHPGVGRPRRRLERTQHLGPTSWPE